MEKWIRLHSSDNLLIARATIQEAECIMIDGTLIKASEKVELGNKLASRSIESGEQIIKYGIPIGTAISFIAVGSLVHVHNIKSNYIPTYSI
jgi:altronate dehydratase small subunit